MDDAEVVAGASAWLGRLLAADPVARAVLADLDARPPLDPAADHGELAAWKRREHLRIAARDLTGRDDLPAVGAALAAMASDVLAAACRLAGAAGLAVVGMGKLGGAELNYASDVDLLFVGSGEADAREVLRIARRAFRVDTDLRPEGRNGPLVRTLPSYEAYWERCAQPWEFQALLKARPVAGDPAVGGSFAAAASERLWGRLWTADDLRSLRTMKARAEADVARRGLAGRELKRGAGGIRDVEFAVQLLQLVHGRQDPSLRSPTTLVALAELAAAGYVDPDDARRLDGAYRFLRTVEHRLQLVEDQQVHTVPSDPRQREALARVLGLSLDRFDAELTACRATVRSIHERLYFRPLLEAFGPGTDERLVAFGFTEATRARQAVRELTRGLTRSSRLMEQLLPLLLGWLADSPDPDGGLLGLRTLATGPQRSAELVRAFRESTETARRLCTVLGTSRLLGTILERNPDLVPALGDDAALRPRTPAELAARATAAVRWRVPEQRGTALRRFRDRELLPVAVRDVLGHAGVDGTASDLTALAEATVGAALGSVEPDLPFAIVALGRFGGTELSYASDLDVLFVHDGDAAEGERAATALLRLLRGVHDIDTGLRPEGRQGAIARSLDAHEAYLDRWAEVWERQALVRARPVAGDPGVGARFLALLRGPVWERPFGADEVRAVRRMKARVERERLPSGEDPAFHLKLGRGSLSDVEFCVQLLQLQHSVEGTGTMTALARLDAAGHIDPEDTAALAGAYRFCERVRNRLYLLHGGPVDALPPAGPALGRLARSLSTTPGDLREEYRRVTRRSRAVVERVFYGATEPAA